MRTLSVRTRIILLVGLPVAALLCYAGIAAYDALSVSNTIADVKQLSELAVISSPLIHELQKERGMSAGFAGSKGEQFGDVLSGQRGLTDDNLRVYKDFLKTFPHEKYVGMTQALQQSEALLQELGQQRSAISNLQKVPLEIGAYYGKLIASLINSIALTGRNVASIDELGNHLTAYLNFIEMKERAGRERALLNGCFSRDTMSKNEYATVVKFQAEKALFFQRFHNFASPAQADEFTHTVQGDAIEEVNRMSAIPLDFYPHGSFGIRADGWFRQSTAAIDLMKKVEDKIANDIKTTSDTLQSEATMSIVVAVGISVGIILLLIVLSLRSIRSITNPLNMLIHKAQSVAEGNLDEHIDYNRQDEIGSLAASFNEMIGTIRRSEQDRVDYLKRNVGEMMRAMEHFAQGDLTVRVPTERDDELGRLITSFNRAVENVHTIVEGVSAAVEHTANASNIIKNTTEGLAVGSEEQLSQVMQVAGAVEQMTSTIAENTSNVSLTAEHAAKSERTAQNSGDIVQQTLVKIRQLATIVEESSTTVDSLGVRSGEIGDIVSVISEIANQTNLLALNAAIEAARAGEQGRGFAVVADEVRQLADRTTSATKQISEMIKNIQGETQIAVNMIRQGKEEAQAGIELADKAGDALYHIIESVQEVQGRVRQIAAASEEESATSKEIAKTVQTMSEVVELSSQGVQDIAHSAEELYVQAEDLRQLIQQFRLSNGHT